MSNELDHNTPPINDQTTSAQEPTTEQASKPILRRTLSDEEQAYRSLDDTVMRPMPEPSVIWEAEPLRREPPQDEPQKMRLSTGFLVGAVAIVSFVAGGMTARLSSQMPVLFSQPAEPIEATASYVEPSAQEAEPTEEPSPTYEETTSAPSQDTGYVTDYDTGYDTTDDSTTEHDVQWNFAPDSGGSVGYDNDDRQVTVDYDGYSMTFTLDDLLGTNDSYDTTDGYSQRDRTDSYGYGTGYDTEEDRDYNNWQRTTPQSYGWGYWGGAQT